jgi:signal transduction histidine kinase
MDKTKQELAKFTHDLRTPLSVLRMNLDLYELSKEKTAEKTEEFVKAVNKQVEELLKIIQEFES